MEPVAPAQRVQALDVVRGFALLGIFLMNVEFFGRPLQDIEGEGIDSALSGIDYVADALVYFFVQSKFWTLFSLLFGMGFAVMIDRAAEAGRPFVGTYLRRLLALLAIGGVHALLVWSGDILVSYALCALVMLAARQWRRSRQKRPLGEAPAPMPARRLVSWGIALYSVLVVGLLFGGAMAALTGGSPAPTAAEQAERDQAHASHVEERDLAARIYSSGSYAEAVAQRGRDTAWQLASLPAFGFLVVGIFLIGAGLVRSGAVARPGEFLPAYRRMRNIGLPVGFALMGLSTALGTAVPAGDFTLADSIQMASYLVAGLVLALAYAATLVLAMQGPARAWLEGWLAPAGRMALSNYLLQSLVGTGLFYGYGLGLWGQVGRASQVVLVLLVFALQLAASRWWLARFRFGPAEWLWRAATYLAWPAMRRPAA